MISAAKDYKMLWKKLITLPDETEFLSLIFAYRLHRINTSKVWLSTPSKIVLKQCKVKSVHLCNAAVIT